MYVKLRCLINPNYLNVRITAYVVKVFSMAHSIIGIDEQQVCDPLLYLVKNKQRLPQGKFVEDNPVYSTTMTVTIFPCCSSFNLVNIRII